MTKTEPPSGNAGRPAGPGDRVSHYEILEEIAEGGMGIVYRARDLDLPREIALKCPTPAALVDPTLRARFLREGRIDSQLSHPNIVRLYEVFESSGIPWLAMEFVEGKSLLDLLSSEGRLPIDRATGIGIDIAKALHYAHGKKILHRDLSPKNVLLAADGRVLLTDFGLARFLEPPPVESELPTSVHTAEGQILGTPHYMSPEQLLGRPLDETSDIFSAGAVLYEMVSGEKPFQSVSWSQLQDAILHREPEPLSRYTYECPPELERIIRKCLAKRQDERYPDARDLVVDLRALNRERSTSIPLPPPHPRRRALWPVVLLSAAAGLVLLWWMVTSREKAFHPGSPLQVTSDPAWEGEPATSPDGSLIAYTSLLAGDTDVFVVDSHGGPSLNLTAHPGKDDSPAWFPDGRSVAFVSARSGRSDIYKVSHLGGPAALLLEDAWDPAVSPDGSRLAFVRLDSLGLEQIGVLSLSGDGETRLLTNPRDAIWLRKRPAWSPDGKKLCYSSQDHLHVLDVGTADTRVLTTGGVDLHPCWSPHGDRVYFTSYRQGGVALWRTTLEGPVERITPGTGPESYPRVSLDGAVLAYGTTSEDFNVVVKDLVTGEESVIPGTRNDYFPTVSPDGRHLVFVSNRWGEDAALWIQDLDGHRPHGEPRRLTDHPGVASHPTFSPDGRWIAYYRILDGQRDIWTVPWNGGVPVQITQDEASDTHPDWSPDGGRLAFASDRGGMWRIWEIPVSEGRPAGEPRVVSPPGRSAEIPRYAPDGKRFAFVSYDEEGEGLWISDPDSAGGAWRIPGPVHSARMEWSADGGLLYIASNEPAGRTRLRCAETRTGGAVPLRFTVDFGFDSLYTPFDLTAAGTHIVFTRRELSGDVWAFRSAPGTF